MQLPHLHLYSSITNGTCRKLSDHINKGFNAKENRFANWLLMLLWSRRRFKFPRIKAASFRFICIKTRGLHWSQQDIHRWAPYDQKVCLHYCTSETNMPMQLNLAKLFPLTCQYIIIHIIITVPMTTYRNLCHLERKHLMTLHADFITCSSMIDIKKLPKQKHLKQRLIDFTGCFSLA